MNFNFSLAAIQAIAKLDHLVKTEERSNKRLDDLTQDLREATFRYLYGVKCTNPGCNADAGHEDRPAPYCSNWCREAAQKREVENEQRIADACAEHGGTGCVNLRKLTSANGASSISKVETF
jgi:hypothetical protein